MKYFYGKNILSSKENGININKSLEILLKLKRKLQIFYVSNTYMKYAKN